MEEFKIGDKVRWTTHAGGFSRERTGTILAVVPADMSIGGYIPQRFKLKDNRDYMSRKHVSYLVVPDGARRRIMWPVTSQLKSLEPVPA